MAKLLTSSSDSSTINFMATDANGQFEFRTGNGKAFLAIVEDEYVSGLEQLFNGDPVNTNDDRYLTVWLRDEKRILASSKTSDFAVIAQNVERNGFAYYPASLMPKIKGMLAQLGYSDTDKIELQSEIA